MNLKKVVSAAVTTVVAATLVSISTASPARATTGQCTASYTKVENFPIPDLVTNPWLTLVVNDLPAGTTITDYDIRVTINHTWVEDLEIYTATDTEIPMSTDNGSSGDNYSNTRFDQSAGTSITDGVAPFAGSYRPEGSFDVFNGLEANRTYWLRVRDDAVSDTGTLVSWSVELRLSTCDTDGDGKIDTVDKCDLIGAATASGCPTAARTLSIGYRKGAYRGQLDSAVTNCEKSMVVRVFKVRPGPDLKIGQTLTNSVGKYALSKARRNGRFYAKAPAKVLTDVAACKAVKSPTKTL